MAKYRLMVIDDRYYERHEIYKKILEEKFELVIPRNPKELFDELKKNTVFHGCLIDILYDEPWKDWSFGRVVETLNHRSGAIMAISSGGNETIYDQITDISDPSIVSAYLSFKEFEDCEKNGVLDIKSRDRILQMVYNILAGYHKRTKIQKNNNQTVSILHLSDLHFGASGCLVDNVPITSIASKICSKLQGAPDIVAITGDITHTGKKEEYDNAKEWFDKFFKHFWHSEITTENLGAKLYGSRIIFVPGNHDFDYQLCAGDYYQYVIRDHKWEKKKNAETRYSSYGLYPFRNFAYEITGNNDWLIDDYHEMGINDAYLEWGIRFIHINTITGMTTVNSKSSDPSQLDERIVLPPKMKNYNSWDQKNRAVDDKCLTILLSHHNLQEFDKRQNTEWSSLLHFFDYSNAKLLLSGHNHKEESNSIKEEINGNNHTIRHFVSPALCYKGTIHNGFSLYQLKRKDGIVKKISRHSYRINLDKNFSIDLVNEMDYTID